MPEIGDQLRETRVRNRIDITEVEAATKIRAKYLRALENEEWDLLPGPTFVKTFLRTYADYLGLDARNLVEDYRQRFERPSGQELTPFGAGRKRPRRPILAPWMAVLAGVIVLVAALYLLGTWGGGNGPGDEQSATPTPTPSAAPAPAGDGQGRQRKRKRARKANVRLQIQPLGAVSVCLEDASGKAVIANETLEAGQDTETFKSRRFRMSFGTGAAVMRVDGKAYPVSDSAPIGYEVRAGGKPRELPESDRPTCAG